MSSRINNGRKSHALVFFLATQMLDLVKPEEENKIRLKDLKRCKLTNVFFDTFFNLEKYLNNEQKDPFSNLKVS
jgi:hypothetical protein